MTILDIFSGNLISTGGGGSSPPPTGFATITLDNLTAPTNIGVDLIPSDNHGENLGSDTKFWNNVFARYLTNDSDNVVLDVLNSNFNDSSGNPSVQGNNRTLVDQSGNPQLAWSNNIVELQGPSFLPQTDATKVLGNSSKNFAELNTHNVISNAELDIQSSAGNTNITTVGGSFNVDSASQIDLQTENGFIKLHTNNTDNIILDPGISQKIVIANGIMQFTNGSLDMDGNAASNFPNPTQPQDPATKFYTDNLIAGISWKAPVQAASTGNISVSSAPATIDGYTLVVNDRVLLKDQASPAQNGIYQFNGTSSAFTRTTDADTWNEIVSSVVLVQHGTTNIGSKWINTNVAGGTIGVTAVTFVAFSIAGTVSGVGTPNQVAYWTGVATLAGEDQLATSRGGLGVSATGFTGLLKFSAGVASASSLVNADVNAAAAIAYTKLNLTGSIVNADVNAAAAIAYSKLALTNSIVNADINSAAAIAYSKLAALTINRALQSDGSGVVSVSATTATELGFVSGVTSAIQTQINNITGATGTYVVGPGSATDTAVPRFNGTTGKIIENSGVLIDGSNNITGVNQLNVSNVQLSANSVTATNTNGALNLTSNGTGQVHATTKFTADADLTLGANINTSAGSTTVNSPTVLLPSTTKFYNILDGNQTALTGRTAPSSANIQAWFNNSGHAITLNNEDGSATAANRFTTGTGANWIWANQTTILIQYENTGSRNRIIGTYPQPVGDIFQTSFTAANNQVAAADVTGLLFANASVRGFTATVNVTIIAGSNLYETFTLEGVQRGADWQMSSTSVGDTSGVVFSITTAGQVQYTSTNVASFTSSTMKFRAEAV